AGETTWVGEQRDGSLFEQVTAGGLPLGRLVFAVHQKIGGQDQWVETDTVESMRLQEQRDAWLLEAVVSRKGQGTAITAVDDVGQMAVPASAPAAFRATVRAVVFREGGLALVRPLSIENTDRRPWELVEAFWFCRPAIGGSPADDQPGGPKVPNYYTSAPFWTDAKLGGVFAAAAPAGTWQIQFWQNPSGGFHPDARFDVHQQLASGATWQAAAVPYLWIYAARDAGSWRSLASRVRQSARLLVGH
ncbi:MAG: hypothetical protein HUU35_18655, partial [Armatimonadetes bacterium]|nr:hypothetical protein [Armatimonadota bacterium]